MAMGTTCPTLGSRSRQDVALHQQRWSRPAWPQNPIGAPPAPPTKVFLPLLDFVPDHVQRCLERCEADTTGALASCIFSPSVGGNLSFVQDLEAGRRVDFGRINVLSSMCFIKRYLESIPEPLLPFQHSWKWLRLFDRYGTISTLAFPMRCVAFI